MAFLLYGQSYPSENMRFGVTLAAQVTCLKLIYITDIKPSNNTFKALNCSLWITF